MCINFLYYYLYIYSHAVPFEVKRFNLVASVYPAPNSNENTIAV